MGPIATEAAARAQRIYNTLFPYYVEVCAVTQLHKRGATPGGWGGHATMFMNGVAIDPDAGYPRLRLVDAGAGPADPDSGTGISVNRVLSNVNWLAIAGRDMFFHGGLSPDALLDQRSYDATIEHAADAGWFKGIRVEQRLANERPKTMSEDEFIARHSIGTDFAMSFGRTAYCARLPVPRDAMARIVANLNDVNDAARRNGYVWNAYTNNCSHVVHNALAAAGVWDPKGVRGPGFVAIATEALTALRAVALRRMSDFSFPANTFVRLYEAGNERPIDDPVTAFHDRDVVRTFADGWITTGPGALIVRSPMHDPARNRLFEPGRDPFLFSLPRVWDKEEKFRLLTRQPSATMTDLGANLAHYRARYDTILSGEPDAEDVAPEQRGAFSTFSGRFYDYVARERERTAGRIAEYERPLA